MGLWPGSSSTASYATSHDFHDCLPRYGCVFAKRSLLILLVEFKDDRLIEKKEKKKKEEEEEEKEKSTPI